MGQTAQEAVRNLTGRRVTFAIRLQTDDRAAGRDGR
jgi:hypothetical protein